MQTEQLDGNNGNPFRSCSDFNGDVRKVIVYSGGLVDSIQFMVRSPDN